MLKKIKCFNLLINFIDFLILRFELKINGTSEDFMNIYCKICKRVAGT